MLFDVSACNRPNDLGNSWFAQYTRLFAFSTSLRRTSYSHHAVSNMKQDYAAEDIKQKSLTKHQGLSDYVDYCRDKHLCNTYEINRLMAETGTIE